MIGAQVAQQPFEDIVRPGAIAAVLAGRALAIYPLSAWFARTKLHLDMRHQHVLVWGGLRGALALGLALSLPPTVRGRSQVITVAFAIVAFSIVIQGLTMFPLLQRLKLVGKT